MQRRHAAAAAQAAVRRPAGAIPVREKKTIDMSFLLLVLILVAFGMVMVFSASYANALYYEGDSFYYIRKHAMFVGIGLVSMFITSKIPYYIYQRLAMVIYIVCLALMALVVILNKGKPGRWIYLFGFSIQPSELMKLGLIITFAALIAKNYKKMGTFWYGVGVFALLLIPVIGIMMLQHHLSGTIIMCVICGIMMFVGGTKIRYFVSVVAAGAAGMLFLFLQKADYMKERIDIMRDPFSDPLGSTWQTIQSLVAIGSGGIMGRGLGNSNQKYLYLPEPQNDFIFAIICEELGLLGAILIIVLFILLVYRGLVIANRAPNKFASMLVAGITIQIALQALLNIGVVSNSIPNTGISLPFFSAGGTALIIQLAEMGIVLNVSRHASIERTSS